MPALRRTSLWTLTLILCTSGIGAGSPPTLDAGARQRVVTQVASIMTEKYVDPKTGRAMASRILSRLEEGAYDSLDGVESFCATVTSDLRSVSNDRHLFVFFSPEEAREVAARKKLLPPDEIQEIENQHHESSRRENFGFRRVEILDGNVGYLDLRIFPGIEDGAETAAAAMAFLSDTDAIIIDLRNNGGGSDLVSFLSSYFFTSQPVELNGAYFRESGTVERSWTLRYVPGRRLPDIDLYILTSSRTFSAAEDFTYGLQQLERAVVVGERTKGGAHPIDVLIVEGDILTQVSIGKSVNPITKTNWEGVGVQPDVEVPSNEALAAAHRLALETLVDKTTDEGLREELSALIEEMDQASPVRSE
jgi:hypothetical protein